MDKESGITAWKPAVSRSGGPLYLAVADALAADIAAGRLPPGTRLPAQRALADMLGIDFTTVSRAYAEARRRGLVDAFVGQGTFVRRRPAPAAATLAAGLVDMGMNLPPRFEDAALVRRMWSDMAGLEASGGLDLLLRYQDVGGTAADRMAGVHWLADRIPSVGAERLLVCPGAQGALLAVAGLLAGAGGSICAEALTYAGFRSLAAHLRIPLVEVAMDEEGLLPEAFDAACHRHRPKALYCTPTLHNPTTATMPLARRRAIVAIAREHGLFIIEDDAYGPLAPQAQPLAALAPDIVFHVAGLAKSVSPALRIAYLVVPDARMAARVAGAVRATTAMASPLTAAIATRWIEDGTAQAVRDAIRGEASSRRAIAAAALPPEQARIPGEGFHAWLRLPPPWSRGEFTARLRAAGIGVVGSDAFALGTPPEAVRLGLGAAGSREELAQSLHIVADLLGEAPAMSSMVV
ncbi:aminotransferase-like domain-containing protein [Labrys monachus]|uniref:DNA-binding transcriptional MocR family regulator n=1 Tax=Labrys monachus TaxID=217067 RepID=A0ABU0FLI8_9HYPH|nr:PLP-dependent aminotransferase family protein [Labrys monachus]MDQ0395472.1 DNA-binding transcriptional MocR family regulator [Labrys monachus]